ncbi:MAG TPA: hypothetical protein VGM26_10135 [Rhizomicrobium sp.]|jgi:hypothetical protein
MGVLYLFAVFVCLAAPALAQTVAAPQQQNGGTQRPPVTAPFVVSPLQGLSNILNYGNAPPQQQTARPAYGLPAAIPPNTSP